MMRKIEFGIQNKQFEACSSKLGKYRRRGYKNCQYCDDFTFNKNIYEPLSNNNLLMKKIEEYLDLNKELDYFEGRTIMQMIDDIRRRAFDSYKLKELDTNSFVEK